MVEIYTLPQGQIRINIYDKKLSIGILDLKPWKELEKHQRPVDEQLLQMEGESIIKFFNKEELIKEEHLMSGDRLIIPANTSHVHCNPLDKLSRVMWKFKGDITKILDKIRKDYA